MPKSEELCQLVSRAISHTAWNRPRIRDGDRSSAPHSTKNFTASRNFLSGTFPSPDKVPPIVTIKCARLRSTQHTVAIT